MKRYEAPVLETVILPADVITTSGRNPIETEEDVFGRSINPDRTEN